MRRRAFWHGGARFIKIDHVIKFGYDADIDEKRLKVPEAICGEQLRDELRRSAGNG